MPFLSLSGFTGHAVSGNISLDIPPKKAIILPHFLLLFGDTQRE
jgi:hypothetical protein